MGEVAKKLHARRHNTAAHNSQPYGKKEEPGKDSAASRAEGKPDAATMEVTKAEE